MFRIFPDYVYEGLFCKFYMAREKVMEVGKVMLKKKKTCRPLPSLMNFLKQYLEMIIIDSCY